MATRKCDLCGMEFDNQGNGKVCPSCKHGRCSVCGKEMDYSPYQINQLKKGKQVSCSAKCSAELTKRNLMASEGIENVSQRESLAHRHFKRTCKICGEEFEGGRTAAYCKKCKTVTCPVCGKEFEPSPPHFSRYLKQGWLTCGGQRCRVEMTRRNLLEKEGVENVSQLADVKSKLRDTRLNDSEETIARRKRSLNKGKMEKKAAIEAYISENPSAGPRKICRELGYKYSTVLSINKEFGLGVRLNASGFEEHFCDLLNARDIDYVREYRMPNPQAMDRRSCPRYDFLVKGTLIEIDPWHYHNATDGMVVYGHLVEPHEPSYHLKKSKYAMEHEGKHCIHVFDWDDYEMVADMFVEKEFVNASSLILETMDGANAELGDFLDSNHLQGACRGVKFASVLRDADGIVSAMTFGVPRYNAKYDWELLRYCTRTGMAVRGGSQALWQAFAGSHDGSVVSYCDNAKFSGRVYEKLGFSLDDPGDKPHLHWYNPDTGQHFTAAYVNQLGVDKILGTDYGKGAKNDELMLKEGFVEIYDCGQSRWVTTTT